MADAEKKRRSSKDLAARRVEEMLNVMLDGAEPCWDLRTFVREKEAEAGSLWHLAEGEKPLSESQIRRYAVRATKLIDESNRASRKRLLRRHLAQRRRLYARAVQQADVRAALACLDSEAKLVGLFDLELSAIVEQLRKDLDEVKARGIGNHQKASAGSTEGNRDASQPRSPDTGATAG